MTSNDSGNSKISQERELALSKEIISLRKDLDKSDRQQFMAREEAIKMTQQVIKMRNEMQMQVNEKEALQKQLTELKVKISQNSQRMKQQQMEIQKSKQINSILVQKTIVLD